MVRYSNLDEIDIKLLNILKENSRIKNTEISKILNISEAAVRKRIKKLIDLGIIKKFTVSIDYTILGVKRALVGVNVQPEYIMYVLSRIEELNDKFKFESILLSSGDHDIIIDYIYFSKKELEELVNLLESIDGVESVYPAIIVDQI